MITIKTNTYIFAKQAGITSGIMRALDFINTNKGISTLLRGSSTAALAQGLGAAGRAFDLDIPPKIRKMSETLRQDFNSAISNVTSRSDLHGALEPLEKMLDKFNNAGGPSGLVNPMDQKFIEIADIMLEELPYARKVINDVRKTREGTGTAFGTPTAKGRKIDEQIYKAIHSWLIQGLSDLKLKAP